MSESVANPIIQRELVGLVTSRRALGVQIALAATFVGLVMLRWPTDARVGLSGARSFDVFRVFGYGLLTSLLLFVPAFPAASIVKERNKGTLALLFNSPLSPLAIYIGKFIGVFTFVSMLLILSLPAVAACYAMGGIGLWSEIGRLYLVLLAMLAQYVAVGLWISARTGSPDAAMRITYLTIVGLAAVTLIPNLFYQGQTGLIATLCDWVRCVSPIAAVMEILGHGSVGSQGLIGDGTIAYRFLLLSPILTLFFAATTISRLNYRIFDRSRSQGRITDDQSTSVKVARGMFYLVDPQRRKAGIGLINPVFVKEFRTRRFGRMHWILRLVSLCAVVSVLLAFVTTVQSEVWGARTIGGIMVLLQLLLVLLLVPSTSAGLIATERESGGWVLLQMTPLSSLRIVSGKLWSAIVTVGAVLLGTLPGYLVLIWINPDLEYEVRQVLISLGFAAILAVTVSAFVSSLFRRTAAATATAYGVLIAIFIGTLLVWLGRDAPFGFATVRAALIINPVAAAMAEMKVAGFEPYDLVPIAWWVSGGLSLACLVGLAVRIAQISRPS